MKEAVLQHLGIAIVRPGARPRLSARHDEARLPDYAVSSLPLHVVYPETHWMSARARSFLDFIIARAERFNG